MTALPFRSEGKTKRLEAHPDNNHWVYVHFKDQATAFNAQKIADLPGKGRLNAQVSKALFGLLQGFGVSTCYQGPGRTDTELVYETLTMIPLEVVVRNTAYGSLSKRFPQYTPGTLLEAPLVEFYWKDDQSGDPLVPESMVPLLGAIPAPYATPDLIRLALGINEIFQAYFNTLHVDCADFKLEFGIDAEGSLRLGDELSPDNFRLRDKSTGQILDKDVFRLDQGDLIETYESLYRRIMDNPPDAFVKNAMMKKESHPYWALVQVVRLPGILHPESKTVHHALHAMGYGEVQDLASGKWFELTVQASWQVEAERRILAMADELLSNPVIEQVKLLSLKRLAPVGQTVTTPSQREVVLI